MGIIHFLFKKKPVVSEPIGSLGESHEKKSQTNLDLDESGNVNSLISKNNVIDEPTFTERDKGFWSQLFARNEIHENFFEDLEESLIMADFGAKVAQETVVLFRDYLKQNKIKKLEEAVITFKSILKKFLQPSDLVFKENRVPVLCLVGVNGVGKTTTLAKLSHHYREQGFDVVIAAADTFRAAAIPQLEEWAKKTRSQIVAKGHLSDAAAVAFDAVEASLAKERTEGKLGGLCLIDTAGRLENKTHLMDQLSKLIKILNRFSDRIDLKKLLVVDATLGKNGMDQAVVFSEKIGLDGIILTKADTQAKAGFLLTISRELQLPIYFITYGENLEAFSPFDSDEYINALLSHIT